MDIEPTRAERRKERLRARIIDEATKLYHQNGGENGGFENTTLESIADASDISLRTFFRYFESKQDVIYLDCRRAVQDLEMHLKEHLGNYSPQTAVIKGCIAQVREFVASPVNRERLIRSMTSPHFAERGAIWRSTRQAKIESLVRPYLGKGVAADQRASAIATIARGALDEGVQQWMRSPKEDPARLVLDALEQLQAAAADFDRSEIALEVGGPASRR